MIRSKIERPARKAPQSAVSEQTGREVVALDFAALGDDTALTAKQSAAFFGLPLPTFWKQVGQGRISPPFYPAPRAPRWILGRLRSDRERLHQVPKLQKEARRQARLARQSEQSAASQQP